MPAHSPAQPKQANIALSYASSQSSTTQSSNYSSQLCQLIVQHYPNKQLQLSVMPAHSQAPPKQATIDLSYSSSQSSTTQQATIALSYASSQSSTTQTSNHSSQLCQFIVQHHSNKKLQLSVMTAHGPAPPKQATIALSYASSQSCTTQTSNHSSHLCQLIVPHHPNKQLYLSVMPVHSPAPPKQATIALSYASSWTSTTQTSNYSSRLCQLIVQQHPIKQPQLSVMPAHSPAPSKQQLQLSVMTAHSPTPPKQATIALSYARSLSSTIQTSNYSSQLCQLIVQHHTNKQLQVSVMPAHCPAPLKQATITLSYASSLSSIIQTSNYSSQLCQLIVENHPNKQPQLSVKASSQSSITQTSNLSSQLCQLIVQHHSNKQPQLSVMPAHSPAPLKQATIALSYARSQSSTTQTSNHGSQLCQLIVQHQSNKQLQLPVMPAHSPAPPKQATIALSYASSQSSTSQTSNYSSQLCQLTVQNHPNKQPQFSVMPAHSPVPPKQATIALSYASSQSSTTQTSNYSSQLCQLIIQHHPNKQPQFSVMPAHSPAPLKQATIAPSYASSQSSTTQTSNYSSQLCQLTVQHHPNKQLQLSVMPTHSPAPPKQATIAPSYASSQSSTTQTSNYSSQFCQLTVKHHPNKQPQLSVMPARSQHHPNRQPWLSVMPAHRPAPPKQATTALSYASS